MTVIVKPAIVVLEGHCPVEEAETLLLALQENPKRKVDVTALMGVHTAIAQILLMKPKSITGTPHDAFVRDILLPALGRGGKTK